MSTTASTDSASANTRPPANAPAPAQASSATTRAQGPKPMQGLGPMLRHQFRYTVLDPALFAFSIGLPIVMYLMFGAFPSYASQWSGHSNVSAQVMFGMGAYGGALAAASIGAQVGIERGMGWSRQVALTPMKSGTYMLGKLALSLISAVFSLLALMVVGLVVGARAEAQGWAAPPLLILVGCLATASMGLAVGYMFRSDAAYSIIGGGSAILGFLGGMFVPLTQMPDFFQNLAPYTPLYGVHQLSQWPLRDVSFDVMWVANIAAWTALFGAIALWRMSRDTARR